MLRHFAFILLSFALTSVVHAQKSALDSVTVNPNAPATNTAIPGATSAAQPPASAAYLIHQALELIQQKQLDAAMEKINAAIQAAPDNVDCYGLRGGLYAEKKQWDLASADYNKVLQMAPTNSQAKFNLAEISFLQKKYDQAKPTFLGLKNDKNLGDLATYKAFLCDLFGGHDDLAAKDLTDMDQVGSGPSFYFGKAAWALYHKQMDDARTWLTSAANIYSAPKFKLYTSSLFDLGYLPIPAPQKS